MTWFFETWPALLLGAAALAAGLWSGSYTEGSGRADSGGPDSPDTVASAPETPDAGRAPVITARFR